MLFDTKWATDDLFEIKTNIKQNKMQNEMIDANWQ